MCTSHKGCLAPVLSSFCPTEFSSNHSNTPEQANQDLLDHLEMTSKCISSWYSIQQGGVSGLEWPAINTDKRLFEESFHRCAFLITCYDVTTTANTTAEVKGRQ